MFLLYTLIVAYLNRFGVTYFSPVSEERRMCVFFRAGHPGLKNEGAFTRVLPAYVNPFFPAGDLLNPM